MKVITTLTYRCKDKYFRMQSLVWGTDNSRVSSRFHDITNNRWIVFFTFQTLFYLNSLLTTFTHSWSSDSSPFVPSSSVFLFVLYIMFPLCLKGIPKQMSKSMDLNLCLKLWNQTVQILVLPLSKVSSWEVCNVSILVVPLGCFLSSLASKVRETIKYRVQWLLHRKPRANIYHHCHWCHLPGHFYASSCHHPFFPRNYHHILKLYLALASNLLDVCQAAGVDEHFHRCINSYT